MNISAPLKNSPVPDRTWFFFTLLFIIIDYGRPQDFIPIGFLRPAMLVNLILIYFVIISGRFSRYSCKQMSKILFFILLLAVYIPFARNNYFAWKTTKTMLLYLPFMLSVIATVTTIDRFKKLITVLLLLMVYVTQYCLTHGGVGSGNYFADENDVSLYINMYLPFCYFLYFYEQKVLKKLLYLGGIGLGLAGVVITFSRGGFVGLLAMGAVVWINSPRKVMSALFITLIAGIFYISAGDSYIKEMSTVTDTKESTASSRIESWKAGWLMFIDNPLGVGGGNYPIWFSEYQGDSFKKSMWGRVAHSLWFTLIPELGLVGIYLYFTLLYTNIRDAFFLRKLSLRQNRDIQYLNAFSLSFLASLAGYFASGTFISVLYYAHYWYLIPVLIVAVRIGKDISMPEKLNESNLVSESG